MKPANAQLDDMKVNRYMIYVSRWMNERIGDQDMNG